MAIVSFHDSQRALALCMSSCHRLGEASLLSGLEPSLLRTIWQLLPTPPLPICSHACERVVREPERGRTGVRAIAFSPMPRRNDDFVTLGGDGKRSVGGPSFAATEGPALCDAASMCFGPRGGFLATVHPPPPQQDQDAPAQPASGLRVTTVRVWRRANSLWELYCTRTVRIDVSSPSLSAEPRSPDCDRPAMLALNNMLGSRMPSTVVLELPSEPEVQRCEAPAGHWHSFSDLTGAFGRGGLVGLGSWQVCIPACFTLADCHSFHSAECVGCPRSRVYILLCPGPALFGSELTVLAQWTLDLCGFANGTISNVSSTVTLPSPHPRDGAVICGVGVSSDGRVAAVAVSVEGRVGGELSGCCFPAHGSPESMCVQESYAHVFAMSSKASVADEVDAGEWVATFRLPPSNGIEQVSVAGSKGGYTVRLPQVSFRIAFRSLLGFDGRRRRLTCCIASVACPQFDALIRYAFLLSGFSGSYRALVPFVRRRLCSADACGCLLG